MPNFQSLCFIDSSSATARFVTQFKARMQGDTLMLRQHQKDLPILEEWKSAKNLLTKVSNAAAPFLNGKPAVINMAQIFTLVPNEREDWQYIQPEGIRAYLPLLPSPGAMLFCGIEGCNPPVGQLTVIASPSLPFSILNLGPVAATWLVLDAAFPTETMQ
jgi:hypothetical protein